ncbi:MAG: MFS transporter [Gammaproteobacteria bacterium]|nr:MFS transporter [Gammaproteobacteria bacterium]
MNIQQLIDQRPMTRAQISIIFLCFVLNMLDGMDVVVASFVAPRIMEEWGVAAQSFGMVFSAALVGMATGAMFISPFTDVIGRRKMVLLSIIILSSGMLLTAYATTVPQLIALRLYTGLGIGAMLASLTSLAAEYSSDKRKNLVIGFVLGGYPIGATLTGLIAAKLIPEYGWASMFIVGGLISSVLLPVVFLLLPESLEFLIHKRPPGALKDINRILGKLNYDLLDALPNLKNEETRQGDGSVTGNIKSLMTPQMRSSTLKLWISFFLAFFTLYFLVSWIPKIAEDSGLTQTQGAYSGAIFNFGSFFGIVTLGYISATFGLRRSIFVFMVLSAVLMILFGSFQLSVMFYMLVLFVLGFFVQGGFVGLYSVAARIYPMEIRTTGVGWGIGLGRFGAIISPSLGGIAIGMNMPVLVIFTLFAIPFVIAGYAQYQIKSDQLDKTIN